MWNHYLRINHTDGSVKKRWSTTETLPSGVKQNKDYWIPADVVGFGPYNPATHTMTGPVISYTPQAARGTMTYTIRAFTAQEISDQKDEMIAGLKTGARGLLKAIVEVAADNGFTPTQFKTAVKAKL